MPFNNLLSTSNRKRWSHESCYSNGLYEVIKTRRFIHSIYDALLGVKTGQLFFICGRMTQTKQLFIIFRAHKKSIASDKSWCGLTGIIFVRILLLKHRLWF